MDSFSVSGIKKLTSTTKRSILRNEKKKKKWCTTGNLVLINKNIHFLSSCFYP